MHWWLIFGDHDVNQTFSNLAALFPCAAGIGFPKPDDIKDYSNDDEDENDNDGDNDDNGDDGDHDDDLDGCGLE